LSLIGNTFSGKKSLSYLINQKFPPIKIFDVNDIINELMYAIYLNDKINNNNDDDRQIQFESYDENVLNEMIQNSN